MTRRSIILKGKLEVTILESTQIALNIVDEWYEEEKLTVNNRKTTIDKLTKRKVLTGLYT